MRETIPARFREAGPADSKLARFAMKASNTLAALEEPETAIAFPKQTDFKAAFRVTGDEEGDVRTLFGPQIIRLLLQHPPGRSPHPNGSRPSESVAAVSLFRVTSVSPFCSRALSCIVSHCVSELPRTPRVLSR